MDIKNFLGIIFMSFIGLYILLIPKYNLTKEVWIYTKGDGEKPKFLKRISFVVPMYNNVVISSCLYGSSSSIVASYCIFWLLAIAIVIQKQFFFSNIKVNIVFIFITIGTLLYLWILESVMMTRCAFMFQSKFLVKMVSIFVPFLAADLIIPAVSRTFSEASDEIKGTFDGNKDW